MASELKRIIDQVSREKGLERKILVEALEEAIKSAVKKRYGADLDIEVSFDENSGEIQVFQYRTVVDKVTNPNTEISLEEAKELDPESEIGDSLGTLMDISNLGRIAAQSARQVIIQRMKSAERDVIYDEFKDRIGDIVNGIIQRYERGNVIVNLGRTEAILPKSEQIPTESYRRGDRIRALIIDVRKTSKEPQVVLSRTHPDFLAKLFEIEVPEIAEHVVQIMGVAREPGSRSKIAVSSSDADVDPVGACVGMRGSRVQAVVQELRGEKIDIIPWSPDPAKYVLNALAPAECSKVIVDEDAKELEVIVPDDQLSLAIGRNGQNVRLAAKLMGWKIDVKSETRYSHLQDPGYRSMLELPDMTENIADRLYNNGVTSLEALASVNPEELAEKVKMNKELLETLVDEAKQLLEEKGGQEAVEQALEPLEEQLEDDGSAVEPSASAGTRNEESVETSEEQAVSAGKENGQEEAHSD